MKTSRLNRILDMLSKNGVSQMVITDPYTIYYLTGRFIQPGERFLALYISTEGNHRFFINDLFTVNEDFGVEKVRFSDTSDPIPVLADCISKSSPLGIDKNMAARFLLPLMESGCAPRFLNTSFCVDAVRSHKDEEEQILMRDASRVNDLAMGQLKDLIREGMTEEQVAAGLLDIYKSLGAQSYSFPPLVGFGSNAALGHYEPGTAVLKPGDCILIDIGCVKDGYCSDMTRTFFWKDVTPEHRKVYETVRKANETAESIIRPGKRFCDLDNTARQIITDAGWGPFFTHRLGHSIGLEDHEFGDVSSTNTAVLEPGMTFSIEPGIYLEGDLGVRIEDLALVTENGAEVLNHFSKELQVLG